MFGVIAVCVLALGRAAYQQILVQTVDTQSLPIMVSPSEDIRRFLPERERFQSPVRPTINRLRNSGSVNFNLPPPPAVVEDQRTEQLFFPRNSNTPYRPVSIASETSASNQDGFSQINRNLDGVIDPEQTRPADLIYEELLIQQGTDNRRITEDNRRGYKDFVSKADFDTANNPSVENKIEKQITSTPRSELQQRPKDTETLVSLNSRPELPTTVYQDNRKGYPNDKNDDNSRPSKDPKLNVTTYKPGDLLVVNNGTNNQNVSLSLDSRASFDGDKCPTGSVRVNGSTQCVQTD